MKIVFLEPLGLKVSQIEEACAGLKQQAHEVVIYPDRNENLDELIHRAQDAEVVWIISIWRNVIVVASS